MAFLGGSVGCGKRCAEIVGIAAVNFAVNDVGKDVAVGGELGNECGVALYGVGEGDINAVNGPTDETGAFLGNFGSLVGSDDITIVADPIGNDSAVCAFELDGVLFLSHVGINVESLCGHGSRAEILIIPTLELIAGLFGHIGSGDHVAVRNGELCVRLGVALKEVILNEVGVLGESCVKGDVLCGHGLGKIPAGEAVALGNRIRRSGNGRAVSKGELRVLLAVDVEGHGVVVG